MHVTPAFAFRAAAGDAEARERDFPDEVEVPTNAAARIRFQKYRWARSACCVWEAVSDTVGHVIHQIFYPCSSVPDTNMV